MPAHNVEESPCYLIIHSKMQDNTIWYSCNLHPDIKNINLSSIEHHCRYHETGRHKGEILKLLSGNQDSISNNTVTVCEKLPDSDIKPSDPSASNLVSDISKGLTTGIIYRIGHSDNFACKNCKVRGDRFFMEAHICRA